MNICLAAHGKRGNYFAAYNLAFSIKHHDPKAKILLIHDGALKHIADPSVFDKIAEVDEKVTKQQGILDPTNIKLNTYRIATKHFKAFLYLDVNSVAFKSLQPYYDRVSEMEFAADVKCPDGSVWASSECIKEQFELEKDDVFHDVSMSFYFAKQTKGNTAMFKDALKLNKETFKDRSKLFTNWGEPLPEELILGGALCRRGFDATIDVPMYDNTNNHTIQHIRETYYLMSLTYAKKTYFNFYDNYLQKMFRSHGLNHIYKSNLIK